MGSGLPPGFRFHPTDEELVGYYLKRQVEGLEFELKVIPVIELYKFDPWDLPDKSFLPNRDMEWFFFCPRDRKYPHGSRTNRATKAGYWKATGKDRKIACRSSVSGYRKTLVFYRGRAPLGDRTDWVMHEYRLSDDLFQNPQGAFALCRVIKKNETIKRKSDSNKESEGKRVESGSINNAEIVLVDTPNESIINPSPTISRNVTQMVEDYGPTLIGNNSNSGLWVSPELILDSSKVNYLNEQQSQPQCLPQLQLEQPPISGGIKSSSSFPNFIGEVELADDYGICMSPYTAYESYMGFYGEDQYLPFHDYNHAQLQRYQNPF